MAVAAVLAIGVGCAAAPPPPPRGVLENNISAWKFRRYQELVDVEVWVPKNKAVAHTASYVRGAAEKAGRLDDGDIVNAFVTRYQHDTGVLRATVAFARRLAQYTGYAVEERERGGVRLFAVRGPDESWVIWPATRHVVKIGGRGVESVPGALIEAYGDRYPSRLGEGMLEGPLPEEPANNETPGGDDSDGAYDPDNPTPDWKNYKPGSLDRPGS